MFKSQPCASQLCSPGQVTQPCASLSSSVKWARWFPGFDILEVMSLVMTDGDVHPRSRHEQGWGSLTLVKSGVPSAGSGHVAKGL